MSIKAVLGENIKRLRMEQNLSQKELAAKINCTVKHLSSIENGRATASLEFVELTANILKVHYAALFYTKDEIVGSQTIYAKVDKMIDEIAKEKANQYKAFIRK